VGNNVASKIKRQEFVQFFLTEPNTVRSGSGSGFESETGHGSGTETFQTSEPELEPQ
jgi:hypothetical protein